MRNDIHRPSVIIPADYSFVSMFYHSDEPGVVEVNAQESAILRAHMSRTGGAMSQHAHGGSCHICGASALTMARFYHTPSNSYIATGEDCAAKLEYGNAAAFRAFRDRAKAGIEAAAGKHKARATLTAAGLGGAWDIYAAPYADSFQFEEITIRDIVGKLVTYGNISEKQTNFVRNLLDKIERRAEIAAQRAAEAEAAAPVPVTDARLDIVARILSIKREDGFRFSRLVALFQVEGGNYKLWGTLPAAIADARRGDTVAFTAGITRSDKDTKFGFISRPARARVVRRADTA